MTGETIKPHNIQAEQALLGALLVNSAAIDGTGDLEAKHFYDPVHQSIFEVISDLVRDGRTANPITVKTYLEQHEGLLEVGGTEYLARLAAAATTVITAPDYAKQTIELWQRRAAMDLIDDYYETFSNPSTDLGESIEALDADLISVTNAQARRQRQYQLGRAMSEAIDSIADAYEAPGGLVGLSTGLIDLDQMLGGLVPGDLAILAGRPSMGKTALAMSIGLHSARNAEGDTGAPVGFFSCEMSASQLAVRILSGATGIPINRLRSGRVSEDEFSTIVKTTRDDIADLPVLIEEAAGINIDGLMARARRLKRQHNIGMVVIDYLQLIAPSGAYRGQRVYEITEITRKLQGLALDLNVPIIVLSQLSRAIESRENKRPMLSDLRDSGSIEQDADIVLFLYREQYYVARREPDQNTPEHYAWQDEMKRTANKAEIIVAKQRQGPTGTVFARFEDKTTKFSDLDVQHELGVL